MREYWEKLAQAIVLQAVDDYRLAQRKMKIHPDSKKTQATILEVERFFRSNWFACLFDTNGGKIIERLREY